MNGLIEMENLPLTRWRFEGMIQIRMICLNSQPDCNRPVGRQ